MTARQASSSRSILVRDIHQQYTSSPMYADPGQKDLARPDAASTGRRNLLIDFRRYGGPAAHTANAVVSVLGADWPPVSARPVQDVALPEAVTIVPAALLGKLPVRWMP